MTLFFLLVILIVFMCASMLLFKRGILSPTFIVSFVFFISSFYLLFYANRWDFELHINTLCVILLSISFVFFGEMLCHFRMKNSIKYNSFTSVLIKNNFTIIGFFISLITLLLYMWQITIITNTSIFNAIEIVKDLKIQGLFEVNYFVQHLYTITQVISCIFIFDLINKFANTGKIPKNLFQYLTICIYIINVLLTATRSNILELFIYATVLFLILSYRNKNKFVSRKKVILIILIVAVLVLVFFYFAGSLTGKIDNYNSIFDNLANYIASPIYNLDYFFQNPNQFNSDAGFGAYTLSGIYSFLRTLGFHAPNSIVALEYIYVDYYPSNIYTPLRRYYQDFGILGLLLIMFMIGIIYSYFYRKSLKSNSPLFIILVSFFYYPLFFMSIEERLFMDVLMARSIYQIIYFVFFYNIFFGKVVLSTKSKKYA